MSGEAEMTLRDFLNVAFRKQTHKNILYLLFSFPLGTAYFIFLITGLSLGFRFLLMWVGIPVLLLIFLAWWEIASFERQMAIWLLDVDIPVISVGPLGSSGILDRIIFRMRSPATWKALMYLLAKFPLGVFSLVVMVALVFLTAVSLMNPLIYLSGNGPANTFMESVLLSFSGIFIGLASLHVLNLLAHIEGHFAKKMLTYNEMPSHEKSRHERYLADFE